MAGVGANIKKGEAAGVPDQERGVGCGFTRQNIKKDLLNKAQEHQKTYMRDIDKKAR